MYLSKFILALSLALLSNFALAEHAGTPEDPASGGEESIKAVMQRVCELERQLHHLGFESQSYYNVDFMIEPWKAKEKILKGILKRLEAKKGPSADQLLGIRMSVMDRTGAVSDLAANRTLEIGGAAKWPDVEAALAKLPSKVKIAALNAKWEVALEEVAKEHGIAISNDGPLEASVRIGNALPKYLKDAKFAESGFTQINIAVNNFKPGSNEIQLFRDTLVIPPTITDTELKEQLAKFTFPTHEGDGDPLGQRKKLKEDPRSAVTAHRASVATAERSTQLMAESKKLQSLAPGFVMKSDLDEGETNRLKGIFESLQKEGYELKPPLRTAFFSNMYADQPTLVDGGSLSTDCYPMSKTVVVSSKATKDDIKKLASLKKKP